MIKATQVSQYDSIEWGTRFPDDYEDKYEAGIANAKEKLSLAASEISEQHALLWALERELARFFMTAELVARIGQNDIVEYSFHLYYYGQQFYCTKASTDLEKAAATAVVIGNEFFLRDFEPIFEQGRIANAYREQL